MTTPTLYTKPACGGCVASKRHLGKNGHTLPTVDLTQDASALELVKALGYEQAPVIVVSADIHWSGYRPDLINQHFGKRPTV